MKLPPQLQFISFNMNTKITSQDDSTKNSTEWEEDACPLGDGYSLRKCSSVEEPWSRSGPDPLGEQTDWWAPTGSWTKFMQTGPSSRCGSRWSPGRCQGHIQVGLSHSTFPALIKHDASQNKRRMPSRHSRGTREQNDGENVTCEWAFQDCRSKG